MYHIWKNDIAVLWLCPHSTGLWSVPDHDDLCRSGDLRLSGNNWQKSSGSTFWLCWSHAWYYCKYDWDTTNSWYTYSVTTDLDTSAYAHSCQSWSPLIGWWCTYDDDDPDMIWATVGRLMQTSLHSRFDVINDICPDDINICADHCWSLVLAHWYHGSSKRCPAFGSYSETACHSPATDCPGCTIPMEKRRQLNWSHCQQNR